MKKRPIQVFDYASMISRSLEKGAFLTTKADDKVNSMVIGWGHVGRVWELPVFIAYVRESRYTFELLKKNPEFTVNVPIHGFDPNAFRICGTKSGRDMDKIQEAGLTLVDPEVISVPGIKEYPLTLECKVIYTQEEVIEKMPLEIQNKFYPHGDGHTCFYGQIVSTYIIEE